MSEDQEICYDFAIELHRCNSYTLLRDRVIRYNEHGLDGLADRPHDGRPPKLAAEEKAELICIVLVGNDAEASGLSAFTREALVRICKERFAKSLHVTAQPSANGEAISIEACTRLEIGSRALLSLRGDADANDPVFASRKGGCRLTERAVNGMVKRAAKAAGINGLV
jgi:hypothetical protein